MSQKYPGFSSPRSSLLFAIGAFVVGAGTGCSYVSHSGEWQSDQERFAAGRRFNLPEPEFNTSPGALASAGTFAPSGTAPAATIPRLPSTGLVGAGNTLNGRSAQPFESNGSPIDLASSGSSSSGSAARGHAAQPFDPRADDGRAKLNDRFIPPTKPVKEKAAALDAPLPRAAGSAASTSGSLPAARLVADPAAAVDDVELNAADNDLDVVDEEAVGDLDDSSEALEATELKVQSNSAKSEVAKSANAKIDDAAGVSAKGATSAVKGAEKLAAPVVDDLSELEETEKAADLVAANSGAGALPPADIVAKKSAPSTPECAKAEEEATRATSSTSDADRLFYFRRALRLCPTEVSYHLELGKIYSSLGRIEDAEHEFRQVLEIQPSNGEAKQQLGKLESKNS